MKIALVSPYDWSVSGGVNNHIAHLAEKFVELGHEPHIIAPGVKQVEGGPCPITIIGRPIPLRVSGSIARITLSLRTAGKTKQVLERRTSTSSTSTSRSCRSCRSSSCATRRR